MTTSLRKNSIMMVLYEVLTLIVPLVLTPYVSRTIGASGIGIYSYSFSVVSYFVIIVQLGVKLYGRREIAKVNDDITKYSVVFWEIFSIQTVMFILASLFYVFFLFEFYEKSLLKLALCIQFIEIVVGYLDISWLFYGIEKFKVVLLRNVIVRLLEVAFVFLFVTDQTRQIQYILIMALSNLLGVIMMWTTLKRNLVRVKLCMKSIIARFLPLLTLFIPVLSTQLFSIVDKTIIGAYLSLDNVGEYENAYKIAKIPVVIIAALGSVMLPRVTKLLADSRDHEAKMYISKSMSIVMFISFGLAFEMAALASIFIPWFLGKGFENAISLFQILSFMIVFIGWGNVLRTQYMLPRGFDKLYTKSVIYGSLTNIILSFLFVKTLGVVGVAFASLLGEAIICVYSSIKMKNELRFCTLIKESSIYLYSSVVMFFVVMFSVKWMLDITESLFLILISAGILGMFSYLACTCFFERMTNRHIIEDELNIIIANIKNILKNEKI